jgi:hypothetical protein
MTLGRGARDHRLDARVEPRDVAATGKDTDLHGARAYDARAARPSGSIDFVELLAVWVPHHLGWLELIFLGLLASLVAIVGIFSLYVIAQQFRNPGRPSRR